MSATIRNAVTKMGLVVTAATLFAGAATSHAAEVKVEWVEPTKYVDVKPSNEPRKRFRERTLEQLETFMLELGEKLPSEQSLTLKVTNLDLAGHVWPASFAGFGNSMTDVRIIRSLDIPRMTVSYTLTENDRIVQQGEDIKIKDMAFMDSRVRPLNRDTLVYEKAMIEDWFDDTFSKSFASN